MKKIAHLLPTRSRLNDLKIFLKTYENTNHYNSDLIIGIDNDDHSYDKLIEETKAKYIWEINDPMKPLQYVNFLANKYKDKYKIFSFMEDDVEFVTKDWENAILKGFKEIDNIGLVYGDDGMSHDYHRIGVPFISSNIVDILGYMCPPNLLYLWADYFWMHIAEGINSHKYLPEVKILHLHHSVCDYREKDQIAKNVESKARKDYEEYNKNYKPNQLQKDIIKIKEYMKGVNK